MRCDKCGYANEAEAKFCNQCGTVLKKPCPQCGATNAPGSKFCKGCGYQLGGAAPDTQVPSVAAGAQASLKKVCSGCRTVNEASAAFCYNCGLALPKGTVSGLEALGNPAGFWIRLGAYLTDNVLVAVFAGLALVLLGGAEPGDVWGQLSGWGGYGSATLVSEALQAAYFTFAIGRWGQTVGKAMLGLKVTRQDGSRLTYWRSFARYWSYYLSYITLLVGFLMVALTSQKRALHDYVCGTRVVRVVR